MSKGIAYAMGLVLSIFVAANCWAYESMQSNQKTLPNGDVITTFSSSDGTKTVSTKHKDGTVETVITIANGAKSVTVQHQDGSIETKITQPKTTK